MNRFIAILFLWLCILAIIAGMAFVCKKAFAVSGAGVYRITKPPEPVVIRIVPDE